MFLGLRSVIYPTPDIESAKEWYSKALGVEPYFEADAYVGYNIGGFELGLFKFGVPEDGPESYWGVPKIDEALKDSLASGAVQKGEVTDVGEGILMASVVDPFGNTIGLIQTPVLVHADVESDGPGL